MKKKLVFSVVLFVIFLMTICVSNAADSILDFLDFDDTQSDQFGYSEDDKLTIKRMYSSEIDIESPIIKNGNRDITAYLFDVSTSKANATPVAYWCFYDFNDGVSVNGNNFRVSLDTSSLKNDEVYYLYAVPVDGSVAQGNNGSCSSSEAGQLLDSGIWGRESIANGENPCFKKDGGIYGIDNDCVNHDSGNRGDGSSSTTTTNTVYAIRNVSHVYDGKNIKLTWESLGADINVEVFLWYEKDNTFKKIGDVNSEKRSFTFKAVHSGDHIIRFKMQDPYQDINYTAHYLETEDSVVEPVEPVKPVVVGPKENIMLILFGTLILYIVYRVAARKRA